MIAEELEFRRIVIEQYVHPAAGRMAVTAFGSHCLAMDIVRLMARETLGRCVSVLATRLVTIRTFRSVVPSG